MIQIPIERREEAIPEGYVKVVRCEDCVFWSRYGSSLCRGECSVLHKEQVEWFFCADGVNRIHTNGAITGEGDGNKMKFIELHDERDTVWVKVDDIGMIETAKIRERPKIKSCIYMKGFCHDCTETPEEILQKIAEATLGEREEIFQKFAEAEQHERSFMDDWKNDVDDQLSRLTARKDGDTDATDRC